jgi:uncharacterized membrane protein YozB (DUF420 family)
MNISDLPALFSSLNGVSFVSIALAFILIKAGSKIGHRIFMVTALLASAAFLGMYLFYHYSTTEPVHYQGQGIIRYVYFTILISHTILAVLIVPFIIKAVYHAIKNQSEKHKATARWVLPVWSYVSMTGVVIYLMLFKF